MHQHDKQLITAADGQTLTGEYVATSKSIAVGSRSSVQFELLYVPHASAAPAADTKYVDVYMEYTTSPNVEAPSGITDPVDANWRAYKEELDDGAGTSTFFTRHWKILSTDSVAQVDLAASFARPLFANRMRLKIKEFGVSPNFGKLIVRATAQAI